MIMKEEGVRKDLPDPPSEEFENAFCHHGTYRQTCDGCGREHFASQAYYDFEDGELEDLLERSKVDKRVIDWGECSVGVVHIGQDLVAGCPCNALRRYEDFIWANRHDIASYLKKRAEKAAGEAQDIKEVADRASEAVNLEGGGA
jgi:hypothetical protein